MLPMERKAAYPFFSQHVRKDRFLVPAAWKLPLDEAGTSSREAIDGDASRALCADAAAPKAAAASGGPLRLLPGGQSRAGTAGRRHFDPCRPRPCSSTCTCAGSAAVVSDRATQSSLSDLLLFESDGNPHAPLDRRGRGLELRCGDRAWPEAIAGGFPAPLRLIREMHAILPSLGPGRQQAAGEFRRSQNWIGGTRPGRTPCSFPATRSAERMPRCIREVPPCRRSTTPPLIKAGAGACAVRDDPSVSGW